MEKDYYAELGVEKGTDQKQIKKAFRKLAREFHPDRNPGDTKSESRFKEINEAYDTIGTPDQRKEYDHAREMGYFVGGPQGNQQYVRVEDFDGGPGGFGGTAQDLFGGLQDLFGGARQPRAHKGQDLASSLSLTFHEALAGPTKEFDLGNETVKVKIPKGVSNGARVRVKGRGGPGVNGGPRGDLYVEITVGTHPIFGRKGKRDLTIDVPVSYSEAALGAVISIPTLTGTTKIKVPAGTQPGATMKLSGKGVETAKTAGDLLVTMRVVVPMDISAEERAAIESLQESEQGRNPRRNLGT